MQRGVVPALHLAVIDFKRIYITTKRVLLNYTKLGQSNVLHFLGPTYKFSNLKLEHFRGTNIISQTILDYIDQEPNNISL